MSEPPWITSDPQYYTKVIGGTDFHSDKAALIARKVKWKDQFGWLYLWKNDRYVMVFGPADQRDAVEVEADVAIDLYDQISADQVMPYAKAFAKVQVGGRDRGEEFR